MIRQFDFLIHLTGVILPLSGRFKVELLVRREIKGVPDQLVEGVLEPAEVMAHENLVSKLPGAFVIKQLDQISLTLQVVSLYFAEGSHKLKDLAMVERIVHLQGRWLQVLEALLE